MAVCIYGLDLFYVYRVFSFEYMPLENKKKKEIVCTSAEGVTYRQRLKLNLNPWSKGCVKVEYGVGV